MAKNPNPNHTTHYACAEQMAKYGGKTIGCCCTGHECKKPLKNLGKVAAGRKGGKASPTNFKHNRQLASIAGRRSAEARALARMRRGGMEYEDVPPPKLAKPVKRRRGPKTLNPNNVLEDPNNIVEGKK